MSSTHVFQLWVVPCRSKNASKINMFGVLVICYLQLC
jgi:hypothetical protein